jgi:predicted amidohydrolase
MNAPPLRAAAVQFESAPGDKPANFAIVERFLEQAAQRQVQLVVFPECCLTGYWFIRHLSPAQLDALAEPVPSGPSTQRLKALAEKYQITIGAGLVESAGLPAEAAGEGGRGVYHNTYIVALPDGQVHKHRKLHAFEHDLIKSGTEYTVFDLPGGFRAGVLICYDCNIVENVRITALAGADVLIAPHQTGGVRSRDPHLMGLVDRDAWNNRREDPTRIETEFRGDKGRGWLMRWLPSRAHDNGVFLIFSNGVGVDDDEIRTGNAMILDPYGRVLAETCVADDAMVVADLDPSLLPEATGRRWMRARRPDLYGPIAVPTGREVDTRKVKFEE